MVNFEVKTMTEKKLYKLIDENGDTYLSEQKGTLGGHRKLKIYGRLDCSSALRYIDKGQYVKYRVFFADEKTAVAAGYRPCGVFFADEKTAVAAGYRPCGVCMKEKYKKWKSGESWI